MGRIEDGMKRLSEVSRGDYDSDKIAFAMQYGSNFPMPYYDEETFQERRNEGAPEARLTSDITAALHYLQIEVPEVDFSIVKKGDEVLITITGMHPQGEISAETRVTLPDADLGRSGLISLAVGRAVVDAYWQNTALQQLEYRDDHPEM